jgi:1,2-diacylglycerol 3-beta-galactosyltransferase
MSRFHPVQQLFAPEWDRSDADYISMKPTRKQTGPRKVDLIFFDAGGGHRASATALESMLKQDPRAWKVRKVNLREVLEPIDIIKKIARIRVEDAYNRLMLRYGMTLGTGAMLRGVQLMIRQMHRPSAALLARFWKGAPPDLVVSLIPNFNRAIFDGLHASDHELDRVPTPMLTILTDLADYPSHFWIERQQQYFACATERAVAQAIAMGHPPQRIFRTSGMIVRPEFYQPLEVDRAQARMRLGLRPDLPTGLVMFGGHGSRKMLTIAKRVAAAGLNTQLIFMCGHNQHLRQQLIALELPFPHYIEGFTREIPHFMNLADYFVGKPGPGSISEALVMRLPVIVERNSWTMVQERYNTDWIIGNRVGVVLHSFAEIATAIVPMLDAQRLAQFRDRVSALNNRAIFEIPEILETIIERHLRPIHRDSQLTMSWGNRSPMNPNGALGSWAANN